MTDGRYSLCASMTSSVFFAELEKVPAGSGSRKVGPKRFPL